MSLQLKSPNSHFPAGGYDFTDPKTGMKFTDPHNIQQQTQLIIQHRKANPDIYPVHELVAFEQGAVSQEVINQVCGRHPELCQDSSLPLVVMPGSGPAAEVPVIGPKADQGECECGNSVFTFIFCKTCSSRKVVGYRCTVCGKQY